MKLVMSVQNDSPQTKVDLRFGRCNFFALVDTETGDVSFAANQASESGSGIQAASTVIKMNPEAVIVGNIGPKAFRVINQAGIPVFEGLTDSIDETVKLFKSNRLKQIAISNK